jgi:hypothetical protein
MLQRVARERFGMIRRGELLYRLVPPDSTAYRSLPSPLPLYRRAQSRCAGPDRLHSIWTASRPPNLSRA